MWWYTGIMYIYTIIIKKFEVWIFYKTFYLENVDYKFLKYFQPSFFYQSIN